MISKELLLAIENIKLNLDNKFNHLNLSKNEKLMSHSIKLSEEIGELNSEILLKIGKARKEKLEKYSKNNIENEFSDVLFTLLVLANELDIDINNSLKNKLNKINNRGGI